jgi:MFS family permease
VYREIPSNLVLKKVTPRIWIAFLTFSWGVVCMCLGFIHNFSEFVGLRAILGLAEGGLFPGMVSSISQ